MSLADSIYDANKNKDRQPSLVDRLVEKAVENSVTNRPGEYSLYQLYLRNGEIWYGHEPVKETQQNVYILTEWEDRIPQPALFIFWSRLKSKLPVLNLGYIQISDNLFWDKDNGEIINLKEGKHESQIPEKELKSDEEVAEECSLGLSSEGKMGD